MMISKSAALLVAVLCLSSYYNAEATSVSDAEWTAYKADLKKTYETTALENAARYNYAYNKVLIDAHNKKAAAGTYTYTLKAGPFTDMRLATFKTSFPKSTAATESFASTAPQANQIYTAPVDLIGTTGVQVADQGTVCNSGWAYATAKALELYAQLQGKALTVPISAQTYIDCAGGSRSCTNQIPQTAFDFISLYSQILLNTDEYPLKPAAGVGSCLYPSTMTSTLRLAEYARILDGFDEPLRQYVASGYPVVVEIDPTSFEFMNYGAGIFQQPATYGGSHFVVVVGYGTDEATGRDYWKLMNSFGPGWGEDGYMRILRDVAKSITKSAIFPSKFV